jgi:hypothetical protein
MEVEEKQAEDEEGAEAQRTLMKKSPLPPTEKMREEHEASGHAVFRDWCPHCVAAWGLADKHVSKNHEEEEVPTISSDFYFLGEDDEDAMPFLAVCDRRTKCVSATALPNKSAKTASSIRFFGNFLKSLGYQKVINKSDGEPAMVALKAAAAKYADIDAVPKESPVGDHQANGEIENFIKEIKRRQRANRSSWSHGWASS